MKVEFRAKIFRSGPSGLITVPSRYFKDGHVKIGEQYIVTMTIEGESLAEQPIQG